MFVVTRRTYSDLTSRIDLIGTADHRSWLTGTVTRRTKCFCIFGKSKTRLEVLSVCLRRRRRRRRSQ